MKEKEYILTRCETHPDHFWIRAFDGEEAVGDPKQIFSDALGRAVDDLEQRNFNMVTFANNLLAGQRR